MHWLSPAPVLVVATLLIGLTTPSVSAQCESDRIDALDGAAGDDFGTSVSVDGTVVVVGAPEDDDAGSSSGAAYVYRLTGAIWVQEQKLTASDAEGGDDYGFSVAVSGDTIVVGSPRDDTVAENRVGSVYVYRFNGATWLEEDHLFAADGADDDRFGQAVAIDGDTVLVGAIQDDDGISNSGSGYVFFRTGTTWMQQDKLNATMPVGTNPQMGRAVSLDGDVAVLGAWQSAPDGMFSVGAAYVFRRSGTTWSQEQELTASDAADFRYFGHAVAVSGDLIAVGAYGDQAAGMSDSGGAYFFHWDGATWTEEDNLNASDAAAGDRMGWSITLDGDSAVVGTGASASKAYLFKRTAGAWAEQTMLGTDDPDASTAYGYAVALRGGRAVVGDQNGSGTGLAFTFEIPGIDCNANGICDARDIADGTSLDGNTNGIPDECEGTCDQDCALPNDGEVNVTDLLAVLAQWGGAGSCDIDGGGLVDVSDLLDVLGEWGSCP